jgi:hypothetical protein
MKDEKIYLPLPMVSWRSKKVPATWIFSQGKCVCSSFLHALELHKKCLHVFAAKSDCVALTVNS